MTSNNFSFLVGHELQQIAVGKYQIIFNFHKDISVSVESGLEWREGSQIARWSVGNGDIPEKTPWLKLIGCHVSRIKWLEDKSLKLSFETGAELTFFKGSKGYESFQITRGHRLWVF
jgi:hypothetical protein